MGSLRFLLTVHKNCLQVIGIRYFVASDSDGRRRLVPKRSKIHEFPVKIVPKEELVMIHRKFWKHIWNPIKYEAKKFCAPRVKIKYWRHRPQVKLGAEISASLTASTHRAEVLMAWALDPTLRPDACRMRDSVLLDFSSWGSVNWPEVYDQQREEEPFLEMRC